MNRTGNLARAKSIDEHQRMGTFKKERHTGQRSPTAPLGRPPKPTDLHDIASKAWDDLVDCLDAMAIAHTVDGLAAYQYARLYAETEGIGDQQATLRATIKTLDASVPGLTGPDLVLVANQLVSLAKLDAKCTDQLRAGRVALRLYLVEFGLTPASRNRIRLPEAAPSTVDPFAALAGQRPA